MLKVRKVARRGFSAPRRRPSRHPVLYPLPILILAAALLFGACAREGRAAPSEELTWLRSYLQLDTTNPPGREEIAAAFLRDILHREGIATRLLITPAGRVNLYARLEAKNPTAGALVLTHHMDVVPAGPGWSVEPFAGTEKDGLVWGRGAVDAKSLGIAQLAAFIDLHRRGGPQNRPIVYLAVADEERGGKHGTGWLLEEHPELFEGISGVLGEGGANRVVAGKHFWWGIETAQKRPLWLRVSSHGRGGHGSMLNPGSAPHQLTLGLARLLERPRQFRVTPEARRYLEAVTPYQSDYFGKMVAELDDIVDDPEPNQRLFPGVANYLLDSIQVNVLEAGERINVVPKRASASIDIRLLPDTDEEAMLQEVRDLLGPYVQVEVELTASPTRASPVDSPVYLCLQEHLGQTAPVVPAFIPGVTDARYYRERAIPAYGFSPFALSAEESGGIHAIDERITRAGFLEGVEVYKNLVLACTGS